MFVPLILKTDREGKTEATILGGVKVPLETQAITIRTNIDPKTLEEVDLDFSVNVFTSDDGVNWKFDCGFGYEGVKFNALATDPIPWMRCRGESLAQWRGKFLRVELDSKVLKSIGLDVEVL